jgi:hypothetical protein
LPPTRSGAEIVVEEFLDGEDASFFVLIDGEAAVPLASAHLLFTVILSLAYVTLSLTLLSFEQVLRSLSRSF